MTIYAVMINDRHSDPEVRLFSSAAKAIAYAKQLAREYCSSPEDIREELTSGMQRAGWLYHAQYVVKGEQPEREET